MREIRQTAGPRSAPACPAGAEIEVTPQMIDAGVDTLCIHDLEICAESEEEIRSAVLAVLRSVLAASSLGLRLRESETRRPVSEFPCV